MSESSSDGKSAPIDRSLLAGISGGDRSIERRLLAVFRQTNDADVAAFTAALEKRDIAAATRASHRVMGASRIVGAAVLADICARIVQAGQAGEWETITASRDAFYRELERVNAYLGTL